MLKIKWQGNFYEVPEDDLSFYPGYEMASDEEFNNVGKQNDPVKETVIAGSENQAVVMDSNLESISSELPKDPNREKLIQLEAELDATMADPFTMNSDENFRKRKSLKKQIQELGGNQKIEEIELKEVEITPQNDGSEQALNTSRKKRLRDITKNYLDNLNLNFNEASKDENFDKSELKNSVRNIYFSKSAEGEKFPFADAQYTYQENPRTGQIRKVQTIGTIIDPQQVLLDQIFEQEFSKKINEENSKAKAGSITIANQMKADGTYAPHIKSTFDNYYAPKLTEDQINNFELIKKNQNFLSIINNPNSTQEEILNAQVERKKLLPLIKAANEKVGVPDENGPYIDPITLEAVGTFEKDEIAGAFQPKKEYEKILANYKESTYETLERQFATWGLDQADFEETYGLNKTVDIKVDRQFLLQEGSVAGEWFKNRGYEIENENYFERQADVGIIKNVKYSDLYKVPTSNKFWKSIEILDENVNESTFINREDYKKEKLNLTLRQRALNDLFVLNLNPANQKIGFTDFLATATKETLASFAGFLDRDNTQKFKNIIAPTKRERLDNLEDFLQTAQIPLSKEQKENFKRGYAFELFGESLPGFGGDLIKFAGANKVAGVTGINARIAALKRTNPMQAFMATNLLEGVKFSAVMADTDMFFNGFFFGAGSQAASKILPKLGIVNGVDLRPYQQAYQKVMGGGVGMAGGSEFEQFSHAIVEAAMRDKAFMTSMDELYGPQSDAGRRITLNLGMGKALGGVKINARAELSRMATRRKYLEEIQTKIDNGEYKGGELKQKQLLESQLRRDLNILYQQFNEKDLGFQKEKRDEAQIVVESGQIKGEDILTGNIISRKALPEEIKEARKTINQYELNKYNAERDINNYTKEVKKSGIFGENFKVEIIKEEGLLGSKNKAEYDPATNTIKVDISKYRPGVFAQEIGHAMMKAAFGKNPKAAQIFKDKISETVNTKLKGELFSIGNKKGLTFEEAINESYKKSQRPEEYVMNVVEFLSQPKYQHLLLENGIINDLKRSTVLMANRFRMDYSNKKNFTTGEELLEFLFSINKIAEGGSAVNLKNKFEAFRNVVVDGKKIYNKTTGKEIVKEEVQEFKNAASKDFSKEIKLESDKKTGIEKLEARIQENRDMGPGNAIMRQRIKEEIESQIEKVKELETQNTAAEIRSKLEKATGKEKENLELALQEKFKGFEGEVDLAGLDIKTGKFASKEIKAEKLTPEIQESVVKNINDLKIARQESLELNKKFNKEGIKTAKEESIERKIINDIKPTVDSFAENRTKALYDPIAADAKKNVTRSQFRESVKTDLNQMVLNEYNPTVKGKDGKVQTVEKFITTRGFLRANAAAKNLGIKSVEQGIDKQIETSREANSLAENIVNTRIEPTKKGGTPSIIQTNLKVNGKRITGEDTQLRKDFLKEADAVLEKVADLGFKPGDKGFRKALANTIKTNNPELFEAFKKELGDYNNFINENYSTVLANKKALPLEFYVQAEKFRQNKGENMFVEKVKRGTKQGEIREAIREKKATYTENEAQGVNIYNRLNPPKAKGLEFFKVPNVKKRLLETLYKENIVDAVINQSRTKKIYSTSEKATIAEKFQKERDTYYSKEIKEFKQGTSYKAKLYGEKGYYKNAKEELDGIKNLIDQVAKSKNPYTKELLLTYLENTNIAPNDGVRAGVGKFIGNGSRRKESVAELYDLGELTNSKVVQEYAIKQLKVKDLTSGQGTGTKYLKRTSGKDKKMAANLKQGSDPLRKQHLGKMIDAMAEMFKMNQQAAANLFYNQNARNGINRQASKVEFAYTQTKKQYFEHLLQNGFFNETVLDISKAKTPLIAARLKDMLVDSYTQWIVPEKLASILDKSYQTDQGPWNAKKDPHPFLRERKQEIIDGKDVKAPSALTRIFNEQIIKEAGALLNPFTAKNSKKQSLPETLGINVPKQFQKIREVQHATNKLISDILFERTNDIKGSIKTLNKMLPLYAQQSKAALKISKGQTGIFEQAVLDGAAKNKAAKQKQIEKYNSKDISGEFNSYLEKSTGIKKEAVFGAATAMARGKRAKTDFGDYFIPVGAEDFAGLMHKTLARGKQGEKQLEFYQKTLYDPYNRAVEAMTNEAMAMKNDFKALKQELSSVPKTLKEYTDSGVFTKEQAVRVDIWNKLGYEIPGISNKVKAELLKTVKDNAELNTFANEIIKITKGDGYAKPKESWVAGNIAMDMVDLLNSTKRTKHLEVWQNNVNQVFSKQNLFKLEAAYGAKYVKTLKGTLERMKTGSNRKWGANETVEKWNDWINGSVGAIMFLNTRSAVLQTISNINYLNFKDNNPLQAAKAFANQKQYWTDFNTLFNSQYLQSRRGGNKINVNESELALAQQKGGVQGVIALMLNKGFVLTRMADSFAIATGGASMYRNRLNSYKKQGLSEKEAKEKAFRDFMKITEETQQSSRPDRISEQQASSLGRFMLAFANTPMQYNRIIKRNLQDLIAGRGDPRDKMTKITYYGMIQNVIFNALSKALFVSAFSDEEDDKQQERTIKVGEGMLDSLLRGSGLYGNAVVAVKNTVKAVGTGRQDPELQALTISPPLYSKVSKLRNAFYTRKYITKKNMFEPSLDNPALNAGAQFSSAVFNFPLDRAIRKAQNVEAAMSEGPEYWQKVALALGWAEWELGLDKPKTKRKKKVKVYSRKSIKK